MKHKLLGVLLVGIIGFVAFSNDIPSLAFAFAFFPVTLVFHEIGHYTTAKRYGLNPGINWKELYTTYQDSFPWVEKKVLVGGIVAGLVIVILSVPFVQWWSLALLYMYSLGCSSDVKELRRLQQ